MLDLEQKIREREIGFTIALNLGQINVCSRNLYLLRML